ncbi:MAG: hypothetical protein ACWGMZ_12145, partial [Thermoguttaceae bacterium]
IASSELVLSSEVLEGIEAAKDVGLKPIKINMVVKRGVNDDGILPMARYFRGEERHSICEP